ARRRAALSAVGSQPRSDRARRRARRLLGAVQFAKAAARMKRALAALCLAVLAGASAAPSRAASASPASDLETLLGELENKERQTRARFEALGKQADAAGTRALARGRVYARLLRAGLLPVGGGFRSFVDHATRLERLRRDLEADLLEQKRTTV